MYWYVSVVMETAEPSIRLRKHVLAFNGMSPVIGLSCGHPKRPGSIQHDQFLTLPDVLRLGGLTGQ